ncbi:MAG: guanylate kinase [Gammaproteobacteria bacterium]|nr:guanylate kinase [Gammaproteobacteria bacterium]MDE0367352.1 guanylate kinase [Gammaproteobacteria bacterium]
MSGAGKGLLLAVSAPSGAGKTSLVRALAGADPDLSVSVSHTTRPRRPTEKEGINYHFISQDLFQDMAGKGGFLEHAIVFGHHYGTALENVQRERAAGRDVILEIDWQGADQVRRSAPETISIFIAPPSVETLRKRLVARDEDSIETIEHRLREARAEISHYRDYDYFVVNDDFETTLDDLRAIVRAERLKRLVQSDRRRNLIDDLLS